MKQTLRLAICLMISATAPTILRAQQSTGSITQNVNQRNTLGQLSANPTTGVVVGTPVSLNLLLNTAGAPAPVGETVQFYDGTAAIGSPIPITSVPASNLLPYSRVNLSSGWSVSGTAPTVAPTASAGADGGSSNASKLTFPATPGSAYSGVVFAVPGSTSYAGQAMTFSFWAQSQSGAVLILGITDSPQVNAAGTASCTVGASWQLCTLTYTFPENAGTGFAVSIESAGSAQQEVAVWGVDVVQAAKPSAYVSTIGVPRPTGGEAGNATFEWSEFLAGTHGVTAVYAGDSNFVRSTSNVLMLLVGKAPPTVVVADNPAGTSSYGQAVTLTATVTGVDTTPTGTITFMDGSVELGTGTLNGSAVASITLVGATSLPAGHHTITAVYGGDVNFQSATSAPINHLVTKADSSALLSMTINSSLNPSIFGANVTYTVSVTSPVGVQPTGTVTLMDGDSVLGTPALNASGNAQLTVSTFTAGTHNLVAVYSGDSNYQ